VSKGMLFFLLAVTALGVLCVWGGPRLLRSLVGESLLVTVNSTMVVEEEVFLTDTDDEVVTKTVAKLEIYFPMVGAPENTAELQVVDNEGHPVEVLWSIPAKEDISDKKQTRWVVEAFFPAGFRQGTLKNKVKELAQIRLQQPPYNAAK